MTATLKDVAQRAGVSVSAASLVLSGKADGRIADAKAERIRGAAAALNYRGNRAARSLRQRSAPLLGMLSLGVATQPYAGAMLEAAQRAARDHDYDLLFLEVGDEVDIAEHLNLLQEHQVAGVMVASYFHRRLVLPDVLPQRVLLLDASCDDSEIDSVVPDEQQGERAVLAELARAGHRAVGWMCEAERGEAARLRTEAFRSVAAEHGWDLDPRLVLHVGGSYAKDGFEAANTLLERRPDVTALACYNDRMAMGAYQACAERGLRIPHDMSVVGFDDQTLISEALRPGLTTVALPHSAMGTWAVNRLVERIEADEELAACQVTITGDLAVRGSVAAPRTGRARTSARR